MSTHVLCGESLIQAEVHTVCHACLQTREAAQNAKDELNGIMLRDNELRIGWGKAVTIPPTALAASTLPPGLAAVVAAKAASFAPPGTTTSLPWTLPSQEPEKKPHDGTGEDPPPPPPPPPHPPILFSAPQHS